MQQKSLKRSLAFELMAFEGVAQIYVNYEENTCDRQATCNLAVVTFQIRLKRDVF